MKLKPITTALLAFSAMAASGLAHADLYPDFTVDPTVFGGAYPSSSFVADKILGNYVEVITFGVGTFAISLDFKATGFAANEGQDVIDADVSGLTTNYGLYALFKGTGTYVTDASGATTFSLSPGGSLNVYVDNPKNDGAHAAPSTGAGDFTIPNSDDDKTIATGAGLQGSGGVTCNGAANNNNCGSFGQTTSFNLTNPAGTSYFIQPQPFYDLSMQSGNFNGFTVAAGTTQRLNGTMNVIFQNVPEPSSIALIGAAFVGCGLASRRKKA